MFEVSVVMDFSAAHSLRGYEGKCERLHGHNWKVEVRVTCDQLDSLGMVADFKIIKKNLNNILALLDHKYLNSLSFFKKTNPTSEHIAKFIFTKMQEKMKTSKVEVFSVKVWETENSCAVYYGE